MLGFRTGNFLVLQPTFVFVTIQTLSDFKDQNMIIAHNENIQGLEVHFLTKTQSQRFRLSSVNYKAFYGSEL